MGLSATELRIGNYHFYHIVDKLDERGGYDEDCVINFIEKTTDEEITQWIKSQKQVKP